MRNNGGVVMPQRLQKGDFVSHFKRGNRKEYDLHHCYIILDDDVMYTETGDRCVLYQALYDDFKKFCRPYDMFISEVDREKYPDTKYTYRLERITDSVLLANCKEITKILR
jgi:hypothetical protein